MDGAQFFNIKVWIKQLNGILEVHQGVFVLFSPTLEIAYSHETET